MHAVAAAVIPKRGRVRPSGCCWEGPNGSLRDGGLVLWILQFGGLWIPVERNQEAPLFLLVLLRLQR